MTHKTTEIREEVYNKAEELANQKWEDIDFNFGVANKPLYLEDIPRITKLAKKLKDLQKVATRYGLGIITHLQKDKGLVAVLVDTPEMLTSTKHICFWADDVHPIKEVA